MMMYFMPALFTVFMLFLPAGLGVYMFTNSVLAIVQQQVVEHQVKKKGSARANAAERQPALGKGKV
jgi:YidC/Oxa1 family membrane protein insertase